eukprot:gb/GECG01009929.1/.p1 GENE.gb/GECG01009929.1/~~gb/GECG01009929.1/.p1  ORF type:complete len:231 (+),score=28.87 gb/GECG01009929.1/:1-693(+)
MVSKVQQAIEEQRRRVKEAQDKSVENIYKRRMNSPEQPRTRTPASSGSSSRKSRRKSTNGSASTPGSRSTTSSAHRRKNSTPKKKSNVGLEEATEEATAAVKERLEQKSLEIKQGSRSRSISRRVSDSQRTTARGQQKRKQDTTTRGIEEKGSNVNSWGLILACSLSFGVLFFSLTHVIVDPTSRNSLAPPYQAVHNALPVAIANSIGADGFVNFIIGLFVGAIVGFFKS